MGLQEMQQARVADGAELHGKLGHLSELRAGADPTMEHAATSPTCNGACIVVHEHKAGDKSAGGGPHLHGDDVKGASVGGGSALIPPNRQMEAAGGALVASIDAAELPRPPEDRMVLMNPQLAHKLNRHPDTAEANYATPSPRQAGIGDKAKGKAVTEKAAAVKTTAVKDAAKKAAEKSCRVKAAAVRAAADKAAEDKAATKKAFFLSLGLDPAVVAALSWEQLCDDKAPSAAIPEPDDIGNEELPRPPEGMPKGGSGLNGVACGHGGELAPYLTSLPPWSGLMQYDNRAQWAAIPETDDIGDEQLPRPPEIADEDDAELNGTLAVVEKFFPGWDLFGFRLRFVEDFLKRHTPPDVRKALLAIKRCEMRAVYA